MDDICGMHMLQSLENLEYEIFDMIKGEVLFWVDYSMQIGFHQFRHDVNIIESFSSLRFEKIGNADNVIVMEKL